MGSTSKNIYKDKTGYIYDKDSLLIIDPEGTPRTFLTKEISEKMAKLYIQQSIAIQNEDFELVKKISRKIDKLEIDESIFIYSTPAYCYTYVLYKIRKISGYSQEQMADILCMPASTYIKIENRILEPSLQNITIARFAFNLSAMEFTELYSVIEGFIIKNGRLTVSPDLSDYNTDAVMYKKSRLELEYEHSTPIDLYESKMIKEEFNIIDTKFREIVLEGQKRGIERDARNKEIEEEMARSAEYPQTLSAEEFYEYQNKRDHDNWLYEQERNTAIQKRIELLKQFHGNKQFYSMGD